MEYYRSDGTDRQSRCGWCIIFFSFRLASGTRIDFLFLHALRPESCCPDNVSLKRCFVAGTSQYSRSNTRECVWIGLWEQNAPKE